ncbi:hypothetical protein NDU88_006851 [Pleurodeles waltl]|uniref:Uncharacterized protein n=1 Tax=Pleurodeles waltl TaxID=8319 RepID=A0AAV7VR16_PLEWA|nr:hypothetical protein NDU88_006851 [Pleurodeles waltl]
MSQDRATSHREHGSRSAARTANYHKPPLPAGGLPPIEDPRDRPRSRGPDRQPGPVRQCSKPAQTTAPCRGPLLIEDCLLPAGSCRGIAPGAGEQIGGQVRFTSVASYLKLPQTTASIWGPTSCWGPSSCSQDLRHRIAGGNYLLFFVHLIALPPYYLVASSFRCGQGARKDPVKGAEEGGRRTTSAAYYSSLVGASSLPALPP